MADLVRGEASESDEEQVGKQKGLLKVLAAEISGEASESDEDVYEQTQPKTISTDSIYRNNLLQRKLIESNIGIWKSFNTFTRNFVLRASKQLLASDQLLIKSQLSMQAAYTALKQGQTNSAQLQLKIADTCSENFLPVISIERNKH